MNCDHNFFKVKDDIDYIDEQPKPNSAYVLVVCVYCGHVRRVYMDGSIVIVKEGGVVKP